MENKFLVPPNYRAYHTLDFPTREQIQVVETKFVFNVFLHSRCNLLLTLDLCKTAISTLFIWFERDDNTDKKKFEQISLQDFLEWKQALLLCSLPSDEGLLKLKTSAFLTFHGGNLTFINWLDKTKFFWSKVVTQLLLYTP